MASLAGPPNRDRRMLAGETADGIMADGVVDHGIEPRMALLHRSRIGEAIETLRVGHTHAPLRLVQDRNYRSWYAASNRSYRNEFRCTNALRPLNSMLTIGDLSGSCATVARPSKLPAVRATLCRDHADLEESIVGPGIGEDAKPAGDGADVPEEHATRLAVEPELAVDLDLHVTKRPAFITRALLRT